MRSWSARAVAVMGTSALVMTAFAGSAAAADPTASPGQSHAEAQYLSGGLFNGFIPFDYLLALRGASATNTGQQDSVVQRNNELVTLFGFPIINNPHGTPIDPANAIQGGSADQYAQASAGGMSRAASGALSDSGVFGDSGSTKFPSRASINLSKMMGDGPFSGLQDATLDLSAISSEAALTAGSIPATSCTNKSDPVNCLDYSAAGGTLSFTSPQLAAISGSIATALAPIDAQTAQLETAIGAAVKGLNLGSKALNDLLQLTGGNSNLNVSVKLGLANAVVASLNAPITSGGVTLQPSTGKVTIDVGSFVKLNDRAPNTTLTNGEQLFDISPAVPALTSAISQRITDAASAALGASTVTVHYDASTGLAPLDSSISLDLQGSLLTVANGTSKATISSKLLGIPGPSLDANLLNTPLKALAAPVVATVNGTTQQLAAKVAAGVGASLNDQIKPVTLSIPDFLTVKVNVQSNPTPGMYQVSALQVAINTPFGNLAIINLATSRVGSNSTTGAAAQPATLQRTTQQSTTQPTTSADSASAGTPVGTGPSTNTAASESSAGQNNTANPAAATTHAPDGAVAPAVAQQAGPTTSNAPVKTVAATDALTHSGSAPQWLALAALVAMLGLTCTGVIRRRTITKE